MAKRFTDTDKWKKPFIRSMKAPYKLLWFYILDECDHAGIWQVDVDVAQIRIGEKIKIADAISAFDGRIIIFDDDQKWFLPDFIDFQYGPLNPANRAHNSVIQKLQRYDLIDGAYKPLTSPLQGRKDKDKDMDKGISKNTLPTKIPTLEDLENALKVKCQSFKDTMLPFKDTYPSDMLNKFYGYWTEPNKTKTKLRWELQDTWDVKKRLVTWAGNNKDFSNGKPEEKGLPSTLSYE